MDPVTIALVASGVVEAIRFAGRLIAILNDPAATEEQKAAARLAARQVLDASKSLNDQWAELAPR